ncbi:MAG: hypothetical protein AAF556_07085, partial [Pseudomonadota bacterium]
MNQPNAIEPDKVPSPAPLPAGSPAGAPAGHQQHGRNAHQRHGRNAITALTIQISTEGLGLLRNILVARWLGADSLGVLVLAVATLKLVEMATDLAV